MSLETNKDSGIDDQIEVVISIVCHESLRVPRDTPFFRDTEVARC